MIKLMVYPITIVLPMATVTSQTELQLVIDAPQTHQIIQSSSLSTIVTSRIKESLTTILTKFNASYFRVSLSLGGQALLWKTLIGPTDDSSTLRLALHMFHPTTFTLLWSFAFFTLFLFSILYLLRCLFYFKMVKEEFVHHVGVNYLFAPSISWLLLLQSAPFFTSTNNSFYVILLWCAFSVLPVVVLDVKIYGQWFTKGKKFLSEVANPTSQLSVLGNLDGAQAAANMGWKESAIGFFFTRYGGLFGALRHALPTFIRHRLASNDVKASLFLVLRSTKHDQLSLAIDCWFFRYCFENAFPFISLVCRPVLFKKSMKRFSVAGWAYSFPLSMLALAPMEYAEEVKGDIAHLLMLVLLAFSVLVSIS